MVNMTNLNTKVNSLNKEINQLKNNQSYIISKLDEITSKLKISSYNEENESKKVDKSKDEIFYKSNHTTIYKVPDTNKEAICYLKMDEASYKKFRYSDDNYVKVNVIDAKTNEKVDWYNKAYVLDWSDGRQLSIGNSYFTPNQFVKISKESNIESIEAKLRPMDIERLYKEYDYDTWLKKFILPHKEVIEKYDDGKHLKELRENDPWDENTEDSNNMYVKLANLIAWFDIDKIAHNIIKVNLHATTNELKINTNGVNGANFESVRNGLYNNIKEIIKGYIDWSKSNFLDEANNFYDAQIGRIHFMAIYVKYGKEPDESYVKYKLYWSNDECDEGDGEEL